MYQQESIYNLLPKEIIKTQKSEIYQSKYPPDLHPTASTFGLHSTSFPNVCNLSGDFTLPISAHPMKQMYANFGKPDGTNRIDPNNFIKKGHVYRHSPKPDKLRSSPDLRKPKLPSFKDKPITGLKSDKNYIISNAVEVILSVPKKLKKQEEHFMKSKDYGIVPKYLTENRYKIENEYKAIRDQKTKMDNENEKKTTLLSEDQVESLRSGLNKKLDNLNREYANLSHKTKVDSIVMKNKKESLEKEMTQIEKDLEKISKKLVYVNMTKI